MKFKEILEERNLTLEQLPKTTQKKIADLENIYNRLEEIKDADDLNKSDEKFIQKAEAKIEFLQGDIERAILKFNPEVYKKRLEVLDKIHKKGVDVEDAIVVDEKVEQKTTQINVDGQIVRESELTDSLGLDTENRDEVIEQEIKEEVKQEWKDELDGLRKNIDSVGEVDAEEVDDEDFAEYRSYGGGAKLEDELHRLKKSVRNIENNTLPEELRKQGDAQPKKMSKGLILMGVGAFLLTWGAVNFFKERRG
jgi:hypothetical protein